MSTWDLCVSWKIFTPKGQLFACTKAGQNLKQGPLSSPEVDNK